MTKKEIIWREVLHQAIVNKKTSFTQKELAQKFEVSLSTVFNALKVPRASGAIKVTGRNFKIQDAEKFLYLWATQRSVSKDIIYQTRAPFSIGQIEGMMPPDIIYACFSAYAKKYQDAPADYDKVYVYADIGHMEQIKKRFPPSAGRANMFVLRADPDLKNYGTTTPDVQTFVDLWNLSDWYAKEFLNSLRQKMFLL